jgi:hypothetical protein
MPETQREQANAAPAGRRAPVAQLPRPQRRDPGWYSPLFVLAPARSNSSIVTAMVSQHPELCGLPELALFRNDDVRGLLTAPPGWKGPAPHLRMAGLFRALAQHHDGEQTAETVRAAMHWVAERQLWGVEHVFDHLLELASPRIVVEKSPENSSRGDYLNRLTSLYPRARFLHVSRHPVTTVRSMHRVWSDKGYWDLAPRLFHQFCLGVWLFQHRRIASLLASLPPDRGLHVRSEDVLNSPHETLGRICRWLGVDRSPEAVEAMTHPETSPYASLGPAGALGGFDSGFLHDPSRRPAELPESLELPREWEVDPGMYLSVVELAHELGYG